MSNPNWPQGDPFLKYRLRVGRKLGRTIYIQLGPEPSDEDAFVGLMETKEIAAAIVNAHNERRLRDGSV